MEKDLKYWECYCYCHWKINWVDIDSDDFWEKYDRLPNEADNFYYCGDMQFTRYEWKEFKISLLRCCNKYKITKEEYIEILEELEDKLSFWSCGWCE